MNDTIIRCDWAQHGELERKYHDEQWGVPIHDDAKLFKMLMLEGMQAGLSWSTILRKMDALCAAFDDFDPALLAGYDAAKVESLMNDPGIIRNRAKIMAAIHNARQYFELCDKHGSLDSFLWRNVDFSPVLNQWEHMAQIPASTPLSEKISADFKKLGFKFVGPVIIYALMQSVGIVNDHLLSCAFRNANERGMTSKMDRKTQKDVR